MLLNRDVPTIQLWSAYMLEKFRSRRLFGWRMVDFLRKAGMVVSVIDPFKGKKSLTYAMKLASGAVRREHAETISKAKILDYETC